MATHYGTLQRSQPRLRVIRGYVGQNSNQRSESAPVASGMAILAGMVISKLYNPTSAQYEWVLGLVAGAIPHIALQDYNDTDVLGSGQLTGLSCAGQYTLESAFFVEGTTANWDEGATITAYANTDVTVSNRGKLRLTVALSGDPIIGTLVKHKDDLEDASAYTSNVVPDGSGRVEVARFDTSFIPGNVA